MLNKKTQIFGRLICKYSLPLDEVEELNNVYDEHKKELISNGARLVGRIESELEITRLSCWINDMVEGEYNPPHTHHDGRGWSTVLFLKVPEFINEGGFKGQLHKFRDGQIGFTSVDGTNTLWLEPKVGDFYIFEAIHQHSVNPFKTRNKKDVRRSMSFNFLKIDIEEDSEDV